MNEYEINEKFGDDNIALVKKNLYDQKMGREYELACQKSLMPRKCTVKGSFSANFKKFIIAMAVVGSALGAKASVENIILEKEMLNEFGTGTRDAKHLTVDKQNFYYDYYKIAQNISNSENPSFAFYNTVNDIIDDGLSDDEIVNSLDKIIGNLHQNYTVGLEAGNLNFENFGTWSEFLEGNDFLSGNMSTSSAKKIFDKYMKESYEIVKEEVETRSL